MAGDEAVVPVVLTYDGRTSTTDLELVRQDGAWLIDELGRSTDPGPVSPSP